MEKSISEIDGEGNLIPIEKKPFNKDIFVKIIILAALFALGIWNYFLPVVRFQLRALNMTAGILIMTLPLISMFYSFKLNNIFAKTFSLMLFIPISLVSVIFIFMTIGGIGLTLGDAYDSSFEQVGKIEADKFIISTYRSNGGATTSYGITIRQEKKILPGILLVRDVYKKYPKYDVDMELNGKILTIDGESYIVKENVY